MLATLVLMALPMMAWDGPDPVTPESLFAQFRDNTKAFKTLKLQWRRDATRTEEWATHEKMVIRDLEAKASALANTTDEYHELSQEINRRTQPFAQLLAPRRMVQSYRTNRVGYLACAAPVNWDAIHSGPDWYLPDEPVTAESMRTTFPNFFLGAYTGDPTKGFMWCTPLLGGTVSAQVRRLNYYADEHNYFPPLGVEKSEWGSDVLWHPIDLFFRADFKQFTTVGRETIGGHEAVVIESRKETPRQKTQAANLRFFEINRAWIDPERGALPLRIEWSYLEEIDGKPAPGKLLGKNPWKVLETTEILDVEGGGFYPSKGIIKEYGPMLTKVDTTTPEARLPFSILQESTTWEAAKIEANQPINQEFTIPIPKGTYYYNEIMNYTVLAGHEYQNQSKLPWSLCAGIIGGWLIYSLIALSVRGHRRRVNARA